MNQNKEFSWLDNRRLRRPMRLRFLMLLVTMTLVLGVGMSVQASLAVSPSPADPTQALLAAKAKLSKQWTWERPVVKLDGMVRDRI